MFNKIKSWFYLQMLKFISSNADILDKNINDMSHDEYESYCKLKDGLLILKRYQNENQ